MATLSMRLASSFLQEKYKIARLIFTDVSEAELRTKDITDDTPRSPDAKTMTEIAQASYEFDEYWRIVDVLHSRLCSIDWKKWRSYYNSLTLLEFLITHGPEYIALEFRCDIEVIKELGTFHHRDDRGFDWGAYMKNKSERILELMQGGTSLYEVRMKAIKLTNDIKGFGNSPSSHLLSSSSSSSPAMSWQLKYESYTPSSLYTWDEDIEEEEEEEFIINEQYETKTSLHDQGNPIQQKVVDNTLDESSCEIRNLGDAFEKKLGFFKGLMCTKRFGYSQVLQSDGGDKRILSKSIFDIVGREMKKIVARQYSLGR